MPTNLSSYPVKAIFFDIGSGTGLISSSLASAVSQVRHPLFRLLSQLSDHRGTILLASICSALNKIWDLAPPILIGLAVDVVAEKENSFSQNRVLLTLGCNCSFLQQSQLQYGFLSPSFSTSMGYYGGTLPKLHSTS